MVLATRSKSRLLGNKIIAFICNATGTNAPTEPKHCAKELPKGPDGTLLLVCFRGSLGPVRLDRNHLESKLEFLRSGTKHLGPSIPVAYLCTNPEWLCPSGQEHRLLMASYDHPCNWSEPRPSWIPMMSSCHGFCFPLCGDLRFGNGNNELQVEATNSVRFAPVVCGLMRSESLIQYIKHNQTTSFRMNWKLA